MSQQSSHNQQKNSRKRKHILVADAATAPLSEEQPSNSEDSWWEIKEIIRERGKKYLVVWAGVDPETVQPWKPEWKSKDEVSWAAIREWETRKKTRRTKGKHARNHGRGKLTEPIGSPVRKRRRYKTEAGSQSPEYKSSRKLHRTLSPIELKVPRTRSRDISSTRFNALRSETPRITGIGSASVLADNVHTPPRNKGNSPRGTQPSFRASEFEPPGKPLRFERTAVIPDSQGSLSSLEQTPSQPGLPYQAPSQERRAPKTPRAPKPIGPTFQGPYTSGALEDWTGGLLVSGRQHRSADSQAPPTAGSRERFPRLSLSSSANPPALDNYLQKQPESPEIQEPADYYPFSYSPVRGGSSERALTSIDSYSQLPSAQVQPVNYYSGNFESELCIQELNLDEKPVPDINPPVAQPNLSQNRCEAGTSFKSCAPGAPSLSATRLQPTNSVENPFDRTSAEQLSLISRDLLADGRKSRPPTPDLSTEVSQLQSAEFLGHSAQERGTVAATDTPALLESWFGGIRTPAFQSEPEPPSLREQAITFCLHGSLRLHANAHETSRSAMSDRSSTVRAAPAPIGGGGSQTLRERLARSRKALDDRIIAGRNARNSLTPVSTPIKREPRSSPRASYIAPAARSGLPATSAPAHELPEERPAPRSTPEIPRQTPSSEARQSHLHFSPSQFGTLQLGPAEYVVGLPLNTEAPTPGGMNQKETYVKVLAAQHTEIEKFTGHPYPAPEPLVQAMEKVLDQCRLIATHPDLPYKSVGIASEVVAEKEAAYHISMSSKFAFLEQFLNSARKHFLRIFIVAETGKLIDILEIFLRGIKIAYTRLDRLSILPRVSENDIDGLVKVSLVPSCKSGAVTGTSDCLIAMDSSFNVDLPEIVKIRSSLVEVGKLSPVIRLVALNTIEHVQLYCPYTEEKQLYTYIEVIKNLRLGAGFAVESYKSTIADAPSKITTWLAKKAQGPLDLTPVPPLPLFDQASQSSPNPDLHDKRKREDESIEPQDPGSTPPRTLIETKRLRISDPGPSPPLPDLSQAPSDITQVRNSVPSQPPPPPPTEQATKRTPPPTSIAQGGGDGGDKDERNEVEVVESGHPGFPGTDYLIPSNQEVEDKSREALIMLLKQAHGTLREFMELNSRLQTEARNTGKALTTARTESEGARRAQKVAEDRRVRATNELSKVKAETARLTADLHEARNALMAGPYAIATAEKLRVENEKLSEKLRVAEKRAAAKDEDFEFLRNQYQEASAVAVDTRKEAEELRKTNEYLARRAADNVIKLRQMHVDNQVSARDQEIENLKAQLKQRDGRLSRMERENERRTASSRGPTPTSAVSYRKSPTEPPSGTTSGFQVTKDASSQLEPIR